MTVDNWVMSNELGIELGNDRPLDKQDVEGSVPQHGTFAPKRNWTIMPLMPQMVQRRNQGEMAHKDAGKLGLSAS